MINVHVPEGHLREKIYAVHVLLYDYLGLQYTITVEEKLRHYQLSYDEGVVRLADDFFTRFDDITGYLAPGNVPAHAPHATTTGLNDATIIYGSDTLETSPESVDCGIDILASTFFMLTRWEELVVDARDNHDRFPANAALAHKSGFLHRPVVCEYAALLRKWLIDIGVPSAAMRDREYQPVLTVDVDHPWLASDSIDKMRKTAGETIRTRSLMKGLRIGKALVAGEDPWDTYDQLMDIAEAAGTTAHFFFIAGGTSEYDPGYDIEDPRLSRIMERISARGHQIGLHPSYKAGDQRKEFSRQATRLKTVSGTDQLTGRQHYLRFAVPYTWRDWESIGASWDSSVGYPEAPGFRCGTCWSYPVFDVLGRRMLNLEERPLILMDATLKNYMNLTPEEAISTVRTLREQVALHNGEFVVLWHNSSFFTQTWNDYQVVLTNLFT